MTGKNNPTGLDISMERVTPAIAEKWLAKNTHNRDINKRVVAGLSRDMEDGNWLDNGATITFAEDGTLLDGQHRLTAVVESGVSITVIVVRGASMGSQHTMDTGAKRTLANALKLRGEKSYTHMAAAIVSNIAWDRGEKSFRPGANRKATNSEAMDYLDRNPWIRDQIVEVNRVTSRLRGVPTGVVSVLYRVFSEIDPFDADAFFDKLSCDEDHHRGEPIYAARKVLMEDAARTNGHRDNKWKAAILIKAWNKFRDGEEVVNLRYSAGGASPEKFPEAH